MDHDTPKEQPESPAEPPVEKPAPTISFDQFDQLDLRIATVLEAVNHPNADRLLLLKVDLGEEQPRQIVAGIKSHYSPESLVGKQVVVLANLKPAKIRGESSNGMMLAASGGELLSVLCPERPLPAGSTIS